MRPLSRCRKVHAGEAVRPADELRRMQRSQDRLGASGVDRHVRPAGELAHAQRIDAALRCPDISRDRGDRRYVQFGLRAQRQQNRQSVILTRISVDDHWSCHALNLHAQENSALVTSRQLS